MVRVERLTGVRELAPALKRVKLASLRSPRLAEQAQPIQSGSKLPHSKAKRRSAHHLASARKNPPKTAEDYLLTLEDQGLTRTVERLRELVDLI
jgi:hypothetical protein